jgi:NAD+ kinase
MLRRLGLLVHPTRALSNVLEEIASWAGTHCVVVGQVVVSGQTREVAEPIAPEDCDLLVAVGGDGTTLLALHEGAPASRPVLGIACGSVGVLTSVKADQVTRALDQVGEGHWTAQPVPGLDIASSKGPIGVGINDVALIRDGPGQVVIAITVDGVLYVRLAGDGIVVATALGSSAYSMAAGGPLLAPGAEGMVVTPLAPHGGSAAPLVAAPGSTLTLKLEPTYSGVRCDMDGRSVPMSADRLTLRHRPDYAVRVELADEEPRLTGLRRRGLILDGPRVLIRELRGG